MNIDLKAYIPKTLPQASKIDVSRIKETIDLLDKKALIKGFTCVLAAYALLFLYVWVSSESTIRKLESTLPSISAEISKIKPKKEQTTEPENNDLKNNFLIEGLSQQTSVGTLPIIRSSDYLTSFRAYQTSFTLDTVSQKPVISFILEDYGLAQRSSNLATKTLPSEVSLMLSPYAKSHTKWITRAHNNGHEVWMQIPIQNEQTTDLGSETIFHHASLNDKQNTIYETISGALGYVGLGANTDESFKSAQDDYIQLFDEIYSRGLGYLELNPDAPAIIEGKAFAKGAPYIKADIKILRMSGDFSFDTLEEIAQKKGHAVAVIPNYSVAINNLETWLEKVGKVDYQIAPISAIYDLPTQKNISPSELQSDDLIDPEKEKHGKTHNH